jgi:hypothetical protein
MHFKFEIHWYESLWDKIVKSVPSAEVCWIEHINKLLVVVVIYSAQPLKTGGV